MAAALPDRARDAHYHPVAASARWAEFVGGLAKAATASEAERARREDQRRRETTYARGTQGGH